MKALIMAAGVGSRISRHLNNQPKCCVRINGKELIRHTFETLHKKGITDIAIVTGYAKEHIFKALDGFEYKNFTNPFFDITNSIASAWFAKEFLDGSDEMIVLNGDVFMEEAVLDVLLQKHPSPLFLADSTRKSEADYRFGYQDDILQKYGKELSDEETTGEYVGIAKLSSKDVGFMKEELERFINSQKHSYWWEDVFYRNIEKKPIHIKDIKPLFWAEVDYIEDYERILEYADEQAK